MSEIDTSNVTVHPACPRPCSSCPWRIANQGSKPDPHKFYTKANLARLWRGLRDGARMSCHPTDPRMAEFAGYEALADREDTHECAGALVLQQREVTEFQDIALADPKGPTLKTYRKLRPKGMTRNGLASVISRAMFRGTMLSGTDMSSPDLNDKEIGYDVLGMWKTRETS